MIGTIFKIKISRSLFHYVLKKNLIKSIYLLSQTLASVNFHFGALLLSFRNITLVGVLVYTSVQKREKKRKIRDI